MCKLRNCKIVWWILKKIRLKDNGMVRIWEEKVYEGRNQKELKQNLKSKVDEISR